jgi:large subunit ribosomal protein L9
MQVILLERIEKLGHIGDVVDVRAGYARNFLIPQAKAARATKANLADVEARKAALDAENLKKIEDAKTFAAKLNGVSVTLIRQAGDTGQLYGSVSARDIAVAFTEAGYALDRNQIILNEPIKTLGVTPVTVRLHADVKVTVSVNVAKTEEEAAAQAADASALLETPAENADAAA